jgi:hypothetical protein
MCSYIYRTAYIILTKSEFRFYFIHDSTPSNHNKSGESS